MSVQMTSMWMILIVTLIATFIPKQECREGALSLQIISNFVFVLLKSLLFILFSAHFGPGLSENASNASVFT